MLVRTDRSFFNNDYEYPDSGNYPNGDPDGWYIEYSKMETLYVVSSTLRKEDLHPLIRILDH